MPVDDIPASSQGGVQVALTACVAAPAPVLRAGLRALLNNIEGIDEIIEINFLEEFESLSSNVKLLIIAPGAGSSADLRDVLGSELAISILILISDDQESIHITPDLSGRAWGVLPLEASPDEIEAAIHALTAGLLVGSPALFNPLIGDPLVNVDEQIVDPLTEREIEVLQLLAQGMANKQIALQLGISEHTVKFHISGIYTKLGATNRTAAVRLGVRGGLILL